MDSPSKTSVDSRKTTTDATFPIIFTNDLLQEDLFSASYMTIEEQTMDGVQKVRPDDENTLFPLILEGATDEMCFPSLSYSMPRNIYDDLMAQLSSDNDICQLGESTFEDEPILLDDISLEVLKTVEELEQKLASSTAGGASASIDASVVVGANASASVVVGANASASVNANIDASVVVGVDASASVNASIDASVVVGANATATVNASIDASVVVDANASASTTARSATIDPQDPSQVDVALGDSMFPNTKGNPITQFQSVLPDDGSSSSHQQFPKYLPYQMIAPQGIPAMMPQSNQEQFCLQPPPFEDFPKFVPAWEGSLVGKVHSYRQFLSQARAVRNPTSPITLTSQWSCRLNIGLFIPTTAINYTMKICGGPIDYVFFHIIQFNNLDLYEHLMSTNLCAKIELPSQTVILSAATSKYHLLGAIFSGDTIFVEPV